MLQRSEGKFKGHNDHGLYYQKWFQNKNFANLVITHGHGEHSGSYQRLVEALSGLQLNFYAWDLRGHGKSDGQRGYAADFNEYALDFELFLKKLTLEKEIMGKPLFLLAHSMGGLIQMKVLCQHTAMPITATIFSAPMFGLAFEVPAYKDKGARLLNRILPKLTLDNELKHEDLSRDLDVIREYEMDNLRHQKMSSGAYLGSLSCMSFVRATCAKFKYPTLFQMSEVDPVTSYPAANEIFNHITSDQKSFISYPNCKHEIYNDLDREQVFQDLKDFLIQQGVQK
jgi:alpha-beta hydrolase superfamily lysophospholipase